MTTEIVLVINTALLGAAAAAAIIVPALVARHKAKKQLKKVPVRRR